MVRLSRYFIKGQPKHIIQRGNNRELIFADDEDYVLISKSCRTLKNDTNYSFMPMF